MNNPLDEFSLGTSQGYFEYCIDNGIKVLVINHSGELLYQCKQGRIVITPYENCQEPVAIIDERKSDMKVSIDPLM